MKLVANVYNLEELNSCKAYVSAIMIEDSFLSNPHCTNYDTKDMINEANNLGITPILKVNRMVHPYDVDRVNLLLKDYLNEECLFYVTDLGVVNIFKKLNALNRVIYDPVTMICNSLDAKNYLDFGFDTIGLSLEITLEDVKAIISKLQYPIFYQVFGYHLMFHSKRNLISLYETKVHQQINKDNLWLEEATRNDLYPVIENEQGTLIYRSHIISLLKEIKNLDLKYAYLEHFRIESNDYIEVIKIYSEYIQNEIDLTLALQKLELLHLPYGDGFSYQDSVYQKEEF